MMCRLITGRSKRSIEDDFEPALTKLEEALGREGRVCSGRPRSRVERSRPRGNDVPVGRSEGSATPARAWCRHSRRWRRWPRPYRTAGDLPPTRMIEVRKRYGGSVGALMEVYPEQGPGRTSRAATTPTC